MSKLSVSLLGGFSVTLGDRPVTGFESNKVRALLAYLVTEADRAHSRDKLAALLWPDMPDQAARSNLRYALSNLRKVIGDVSATRPVLCISPQTVQLDLNGNIDADVLTFNHQLGQSPLTPSNLEEAVRVYQGDFLEGFYIGGDSAFEEWVVLKREQLRRQALEALHHLAQAYQKNGDLTNALTTRWRLVDLEPWSEEAHRDLMLLLGLSGKRAAALAQYETCCRMLAKELHVEPSTETTRIYEQIRDGKIKPLSETVVPVSPPVRANPGTAVQQSLPPIPESQVSGRSRQIPWLKIISTALLVITLSVSGYYLTNHLRASTPVASSVQGEVVGRCPGPNPLHLCLINVQTGLMTQITRDLSLQNFGPGLSWSPDGTRIVFSGSKEQKMPSHLYVINRDGTNVHQITNRETNDIMPAWSPDGVWIAYHGNCTLWIVHPDGTGTTALSDALCATGIAWSPDSLWIAFFEEGTPDNSRLPTIRAFKRDGSDSRIVYTFSHPVSHGQVAWSPDGQQIFVLYNSGGTQDSTILLDAQGQGALKQGIEVPISWMSDFYPQWGR